MKIKPGYILTLATLFVMTFSASGQSAADLQGIEVGQKAPTFASIDQNGNSFDLSLALKEGPVIILFYRGSWCPICNRQLSNVQDSLSYLIEKGARVIAISPDKTDLQEKTAKNTGAEFTLLSDVDFKICDAYDVTFKPSEGEIDMYNSRLNADLENAHGEGDVRLPIPATYIINQDGIVAYRHFNPDYRLRSSVADMMKYL